MFSRLVPSVKKALFYFPRKGRIRFFLALLIAAAGFKIAGALLAPTEGGPAAGQHIAAVGAVNGGGNKSESITLDFKGAAGLLAQCRPRLTFDRDTFQTGGDSVVVCYSLDTALQDFVNRMLKQYRPKYGAAVILNPRSGRVLALVSYRRDSMPDIGSRLFAQSIFPAASIFKTVTAAAAIETARYSTRTEVPVTGRNHTLYRFQIRKTISPWSELTFEDAYAFSINSAFARIGMYAVGRETLEEYSRKFGFNTAIPFDLAIDTSKVVVPDDTSYAMAELASGYNRKTTLSPLHGALIAGTIAAEGNMPFPRLIDSICRMSDGRCLYRLQPAVWRTPIGSTAACELQAMMNRVVEIGTCRKTFRQLRRCAWSADLDCGGKTGSLDVEGMGKIDWFIGFASSRSDPDRCLAAAIVTVHGQLWTVHSSYIGAEIFDKFFRPALRERPARQHLSSAAAAPIPVKPKG
ncbi:MAG: penicillin-binding transpeptidase domain-containing protein [Chitinispirillaceae bacterium]